MHYKNELAKYVLISSAVFLASITLVPSIRNLFQLSPVSLVHFGLCMAVALFVTFWMQLYIGAKKSFATKNL
jgi:hypothetical protein